MNPSDQSIFISGYDINKTIHIYQRITEHENSALHTTSTEAYILKINNGDMFSLINKQKL